MKVRMARGQSNKNTTSFPAFVTALETCCGDSPCTQLLKKQVAEQLNHAESQELWTTLLEKCSAASNTLCTEVGAEPPEVEAAVSVLLATAQLADSWLHGSQPLHCEALERTIGVLLGVLPSVPPAVQQLVKQVVQAWRVLEWPGHEKLGAELLEFHVSRGVGSRGLKKDANFAWQLRSCLKTLIVSDRDVGTLLVRTVTAQPFLASESGRKFAALVFLLGTSYIERIHQAVRSILPTCPRQTAAHLGIVYRVAWLNANPTTKQTIQNVCLNDIMVHVFVLPRRENTMGQLGANLFRMLREFHAQRQHAQVLRMLADMYQPLIWRHLLSPINQVRCNAAQVLFDAYPLDRPGLGREKNSSLLYQQHQAVSQLLTDGCPMVRAVAAQGVCRLLATYWDIVPEELSSDWLAVVAERLCHDVSCADVRRNALSALLHIARCPAAIMSLEPHLKNMGVCLYDPNEAVRRAYVCLLHSASHCLDVWAVTPLPQLLTRLRTESRSTCVAIVKLLCPVVIRGKLFSENFKRILQMMKLDFEATRYFFYYSAGTLLVEDAVSLMNGILYYVHGHVAQRDRSPAAPRRPPRSKNPRLTKSTAARNQKKAVEKGQIMDDPLHVARLLDIVNVLWTVNVVALKQPTLKDTLITLHASVGNCLPLFFRYFREGPPWDSLLYLCSMVEPQRLRRVYCVGSTCLSRLSKLPGNTSLDQCLTLVGTLCFWGEGVKILEMAVEWLDEALRPLQLNSSVCKPPARKSSQHVRFTYERKSKPDLALVVLDAVFSNPANCREVLSRHRDEVTALCDFLEVMRDVMVQTLGGCELGSLSETTVRSAMLRLFKLCALLDEPTKRLLALQEWAQTALLQHTSHCTLVHHILGDLVSVSAAVIDADSAVPEFTARTVAFARLVLNCECGPNMVEPACHLMTLLVNHWHCYYIPQDELHLFRTVVAALYRSVVVAASRAEGEIHDVAQVRVSLYKVVSTAQKYYPQLQMLDQLVQTLVRVVGQAGNECLPTSVQDLKPGAALLSSVVAKLWGECLTKCMVRQLEPPTTLPCLATLLVLPSPPTATTNERLLTQAQKAVAQLDSGPLFEQGSVLLEKLQTRVCSDRPNSGLSNQDTNSNQRRSPVSQLNDDESGTPCTTDITDEHEDGLTSGTHESSERLSTTSDDECDHQETNILLTEVHRTFASDCVSSTEVSAFHPEAPVLELKTLASENDLQLSNQEISKELHLSDKSMQRKSACISESKSSSALSELSDFEENSQNIENNVRNITEPESERSSLYDSDCLSKWFS